MQNSKAGLPRFSEMTRRERAMAFAIGILLAALIIVFCISINMQVNMQKDYAAVRTQLGESLYSNLSMLAQTFDMTSVPNADVQYSVLPQMRSYFVASTTLNEAITRSFGQRYQLLTDSDVSALRTAFTAFDNAFRTGTPTDLAQADMQTCITRVRELLASRFSAGVLKPAR